MISVQQQQHHLYSPLHSTPQQQQQQQDTLYTEIRGSVLVPSFSRLLDSDTSLDSTPSQSGKSSSSNLNASHGSSGLSANGNSQMTDAELVRELVQVKTAKSKTTK